MVAHSKFDSVMSSSPFDTTMRLPHRYKTFSSKVQYQLVVTTLHKLQESGFYWGSINGKEANAMLATESVGTFLIRDSSDNRLEANTVYLCVCDRTVMYHRECKRRKHISLAY